MVLDKNQNIIILNSGMIFLCKQGECILSIRTFELSQTEIGAGRRSEQGRWGNQLNIDRSARCGTAE
jgi:hypothetical protein